MHTNIQAKINRHWKDWFTYMQFVKGGAIQAKWYTYTFYSYTFGKHGVFQKLSDHLNGNTDSIWFSTEHSYSTFNSTKIIKNCLEIRCGDQWLRMIHIESHAKYSRNTRIILSKTFLPLSLVDIRRGVFPSVPLRLACACRENYPKPPTKSHRFIWVTNNTSCWFQPIWKKY